MGIRITRTPAGVDGDGIIHVEGVRLNRNKVMSQADPANSRPISPLGGHVHQPGSLGSAGYRFMGTRLKVRICPTCEFHNQEQHIFCANCGVDLADVPLTNETRADAGRRQMIEKLDRDRRLQLASRARPVRSATTGPFLAIGLVLFIFSIWMTDDRWPRYLIWLAGLALLGFGLWRLRYDPDGLRHAGVTLGVTTAAVLILIGARSIGTGNAAPAPTRPVAALASTPAAEATPAPGEHRLGGSMPMLGANAAHTFRQPGPAPTANPAIAWRFDSGGEIYSAPALADGTLYFTSKSGALYAVDATTGKQRWVARLGDYVVRSSPAVDHGTVYVGSGFNLYAFDAATGKERWRFAMHYAGQSSPVVVGNQVFIGSQEGYLYAVDAGTGKANWQVNTDGLVFASPSVAGDNLLIGTDAGNLLAIEMDNGHVAWRRQLDGPIFASVAVDNETAYVTAANGFTYGVAISDGTVNWRAPVGGDVSPVPGNGVVAVAAKDGGVYGLDAKTGETKWLFPAGASSLAAPVSAGNYIVIGADRNLYAIDATTGARAWAFLAGDTIETPSTVADGYVFFGSRDGFLYGVHDVKAGG